MRPLYIAVEGGEGSGKSSVLEFAEATFGDSVVYTREPGGSPYAEAERALIFDHPLSKEALPETKLCQMFAARYDTIAKKVAPALVQGKPVISDRSDASSFAYNVWAQSGRRLETLFWELRKAMTIRPDLYIWLDVDPAEGRRRAQGRNSATAAKGNHFDDEKIEFYRKVSEGYAKFFGMKKNLFFPRVSCAVIDANQPLEAVKKEFLSKVSWQLKD